MPVFFNHFNHAAAHWHMLAQKARLMAQELEDSEAKTAILKTADRYDRLEVLAAERANKMVDKALDGLRVVNAITN